MPRAAGTAIFGGCGPRCSARYNMQVILLDVGMLRRSSFENDSIIPFTRMKAKGRNARVAMAEPSVSPSPSQPLPSSSSQQQKQLQQQWKYE